MKNLIFNKTNLVYLLILGSLLTVGNISLSKYKANKDKEIVTESKFTNIKPVEAVDIESLITNDNTNNETAKTHVKK